MFKMREGEKMSRPAQLAAMGELWNMALGAWVLLCRDLFPSETKISMANVRWWANFEMYL